MLWSDNTELQWCMGVDNNYTCCRQLYRFLPVLFTPVQQFHPTCPLTFYTCSTLYLFGKIVLCLQLFEDQLYNYNININTLEVIIIEDIAGVCGYSNMHVAMVMCSCLNLAAIDTTIYFLQLCSNATTNSNILTNVHAMTKLFVLFCSAQDGESTGMNQCFEHIAEMAKF